MKKLICHLLLLISCVTYAHSEPLRIRLGANPNIWFAQPSIIIGEGWDRESGFILEQKVYPGPAHNLQAFVAGELEGVNNNVAAALLAHDRGKALKIVAATFDGDISIIAQPRALTTPGETGLAKLQGFKAQHGRRFKLATNPRGSLSDLTVRRWLEQQWPTFEQGVELVAAGDQAQLQQLFLSRAVDGCAGFGSLLWLFRDKLPDAGELLSPEALMPHQPGGVLMVSAEFAAAHPREIAALAKLYTRASELLQRDPARAAQHIDRLLTSGFVSPPLLEASIRGRAQFFSGDLNSMRAPIESLATYMVQKGYLKQSPVLEQIMGTVLQ